MHAVVNGTRLWFDVEGPALVPDGPTMRARPTIVLLHGGPGGYDHSYLKPDFGQLADVAQVVYLDLRLHGRSAGGDVHEWSFEQCADDVRAFCDQLGIERPVVFGHSMGGFVAILYGARHPGTPPASCSPPRTPASISTVSSRESGKPSATRRRRSRAGAMRVKAP